jgi:mono/diheme cytochrome c family protein
MKFRNPIPAVALVALLSVFVSAFAEGNVKVGKQEYEGKCAVCHGVTGKGDGPFANQLKVGSTDLTILAKNNGGVFPTAAVLSVLDGRSEVQAHGPREMPIYGEIYLAEGAGKTPAKQKEGYVDSRLRSLIAYLESIQWTPTAASDELIMGKNEYETKCAICHGGSGKGDGAFASQLKVGSTDLTMLAKNNGGVFPTAQVMSSLDGRSAVQGHGPREMPIYGEVYLAEGGGAPAKEKETFVDARLRALVAYLETIQIK